MTTHVMARAMRSLATAPGESRPVLEPTKLTTTIGRSYRFEAAHRLPLLPTSHKCHHMHGHNYRLVVSVTGDVDSRGFVMDFADLDAAVMPLIAMVDHKVLNDVAGLENPTAEVIAAWFYGHIGNCDSVRIYENDDCWAEVTR